jgi:hypothetical protein
MTWLDRSQRRASAQTLFFGGLRTAKAVGNWCLTLMRKRLRFRGERSFGEHSKRGLLANRAPHTRREWDGIPNLTDMRR